LNGRRIRVSPRKNLDGALIATGILHKSRCDEHIPAYMEALQEVAEKTAGIRRAGSAALDLAYVAAGRLDAYWEMKLKPWDIAAGALLVREAGGLVSDFNGGNVVCGNAKCLKAVLQIVQPHLGNIC